MARRETVVLTDDLDGTPATKTIQFGLAGVEYEIDLNDGNAEELTSWLQNYASHARRVSGRARRAGRPAPTSDVDAKTVRAWAHKQGIEVGPRGRIPSDVAARYKASRA